MKTRLFLAAAVCLAVHLGVNHSSTQLTGSTASAESAVPAADAPRVVEEDMHEFMEYVFQPTYRRLKILMVVEPPTAKEWKPIKSDALILAESCNLLFARKPQDPKDATDWTRHAVASREAGAQLYAAAREKKFSAATTAWKKMLNNCNACHRQFEEGRHILTP